MFFFSYFQIYIVRKGRMEQWLVNINSETNSVTEKTNILNVTFLNTISFSNNFNVTYDKITHKMTNTYIIWSYVVGSVVALSRPNRWGQKFRYLFYVLRQHYFLSLEKLSYKKCFDFIQILNIHTGTSNFYITKSNNYRFLVTIWHFYDK